MMGLRNKAYINKLCKYDLIRRKIAQCAELQRDIQNFEHSKYGEITGQDTTQNWNDKVEEINAWEKRHDRFIQEMFKQDVGE